MITASPIVNIDPEIMSGTPVFQGTRVPVTTLFDYLIAGDSLEVFLDDFPTVRRDQAEGLLDWSKRAVTSNADRA